jgi:hypothetical protein
LTTYTLHTIQSDFGITVSSLDKTYKKLLKPFARVVGRYTFAGATPEIFKGNNYTNDGTPYAPCRMKTTRALKQRFFDFWRRDWRGKKTAIMWIDIDQENISPDIWATVGLPTPFETNSNPAYGTCQIIWIMDQLVYEAEYYQIRDTIINEIEKFGVKVDHSKPELMRSPWYDPFYKREGETVKRKADCVAYKKRGKLQADYTIPTVYEWNEYDPEDLCFKPSNLNDLCWDQETGEIIAAPISVNDIIQHPTIFKVGRNAAGSTSLFDQLREACYSLYSNKKLWGYDTVLSIAKDLGEGTYSEKKITDTAKGVFDWIEREFPKSHDATKARNGKGTLWANIRWYRERMKKALLADFAEKEGFSRQYASKLKKAGKIYEQFGGYFYTNNKIDDPESYINKFHLNVVTGDKENGSSIHNKHVNQPQDAVELFDNMSLLSENTNHKEVETKPPIPPPKVIMSMSAVDAEEMFLKEAEEHAQRMAQSVKCSSTRTVKPLGTIEAMMLLEAEQHACMLSRL